MTGPMRFREVFPGGEKAAGHARRVLARWLADALPSEQLSDMQLLVTDGVARVEVRDSGIQADPRVRTPDLGGGGGFGMVLVERMSRAWGVDHEPKVVMWFELALESGAGGGFGRDVTRRRHAVEGRARTRTLRRGVRGRRFG